MDMDFFDVSFEESLDEHYYVCHDGRELRHIQTETKKQDGYTQTFEVYGCADCSGCEHKAKCLYKYNPEKDADKNKIMKINEQWEELKAASHANIQSEKDALRLRPWDEAFCSVGWPRGGKRWVSHSQGNRRDSCLPYLQQRGI